MLLLAATGIGLVFIFQAPISATGLVNLGPITFLLWVLLHRLAIVGERTVFGIPFRTCFGTGQVSYSVLMTLRVLLIFA